MRIIVEVPKLRNEIESALTDYDMQYKKLLKLYNKKLKKYLAYVTKEVNRSDKNPKQLKHPPSTPSWERNHFIQTLEALKAHTDDKVEMENHEYNDIKSGIRRLRENIRSTALALNAISYR